MLLDHRHLPSPSSTIQVDRCVAEILEQLWNRTLRPLQKLGENSFAKKLGMARPTVRVAFERLVNVGVLERVHKSGTFVRHITLEEYCELADVRTLIEEYAALMACEQITDKQLAELKTLAEQADKLQVLIRRDQGARFSNWLKMQKAEAAFHGALVEFSGNQVLFRIYSTQNLMVRSFLVGVMNSLKLPPLEDPALFHRPIVSAMASRSPDAVGKAVRDHIQLFKNQLVQSQTSKHGAGVMPRK